MNPIDALPETVIRPPRKFSPLNLRELWHFRELFFVFVWRDLKVRYKQTLIGVMWAILQPLLLVGIFSLLFGAFVKVPTGGTPYPVFAFSGLLFWNYFANALSSSSNALVDNENIIKKIYFPRIVLPLSPTITPLVDFAIALLILFALLVVYHVIPPILPLLLLPFLILLTWLSVAGLGLLLSSINVRYRDVRHVLPFFIQILFFLTPVIYPSALLPERFQWLLALNPLTGIIETSRSILTGRAGIDFNALALSTAVAVVLFVVGSTAFQRTERTFADVA